MSEQTRQPPSFFAGVDWGGRSHRVQLLCAAGKSLGARSFPHGGEGLAEMAAWLTATTGAEPGDIGVAIETPHGPVVETLLARGFRVFAINPKQLDRFRDRFSPAGAKDDSRDALVGASALRTDPHCLRELQLPKPALVELREWSRLADELAQDRVRLANRLYDLLWRYYPALIELGEDLCAEWLLDLWQAAPTPEKAARLGKASLERLLARHRIRRLNAADLKAILKQQAFVAAPATAEAARAHIAILAPRIRLLNRQIKEARANLDRLTASLAEPVASDGADPNRNGEQPDAAILASLPGVGRIVLATLLAEATDALERRDYNALRSLAGTAPVTLQSGKSRIVLRRYACHPRLANAIYHWARIAVQHDPLSRRKYAACRQRGKSHGTALRCVADRLLNVACAMLKNRTTFQPQCQIPA